MHRYSPALWCVLALPLAAVAQPASYQLDPVHTRILFTISHDGYSRAMGTVSGSTGTITFDPDDWSSASLSVSVPMTRLDMGDARWNRAVGASALLDVTAHPVATFVSSRIEPKDRDHALVCGNLTLRGIAKDTCLDVTFNKLKRISLPPFRRIAGFSATATLSRRDFGIDVWPGLIGDAVQLVIEAEAEAVRSPPTPTSVPVPAQPDAPPSQP